MHETCSEHGWWHRSREGWSEKVGHWGRISRYCCVVWLCVVSLISQQSIFVFFFYFFRIVIFILFFVHVPIESNSFAYKLTCIIMTVMIKIKQNNRTKKKNVENMCSMFVSWLIATWFYLPFEHFVGSRGISARKNVGITTIRWWTNCVRWYRQEIVKWINPVCCWRQLHFCENTTVHHFALMFKVMSMPLRLWYRTKKKMEKVLTFTN